MKLQAGHRGFTLVEMLMVVALIALVAGMSGGLYLGTYKQTLVKKAARDFELGAQYARLTAIEGQQTCTLRLDMATGAFAVTRQAAAEETEEPGEVVLRDVWFKPVEFEGEVEFEFVQVAAAGLESSGESGDVEDQRIIVFHPDGTSENAVVQIGDGKTHYTVTISAATGKTKVRFGTGENVVFATIDLDRQMY